MISTSQKTSLAGKLAFGKADDNFDRILVGLRWWSKIQEDGQEKWYFESLNVKATNAVDSKIFWVWLYVYPVVWIALCVVSALSLNFENLVICILAFVLGTTNLMGYRKCNNGNFLSYFRSRQENKRLPLQLGVEEYFCRLDD